MELDRSMKNWPTCVVSKNAPKSTKRKINDADAPSGVPMMPSVVYTRYVITRVRPKPLCARNPGMERPAKEYSTKSVAMMRMGYPTTRLHASASRKTSIPPTTMSMMKVRYPTGSATGSYFLEMRMAKSMCCTAIYKQHPIATSASTMSYHGSAFKRLIFLVAG